MNQAHEALIRKLESIGTLGPDERKALAALPVRLATLARGEEAARDGTRTTECCLLVTGFMHRLKLLPDGGRQILAFHPAGDIPDLQSLHLKTMDHTLAATSACTVGFIRHEDMLRMVHENAVLSDLMWRDTLIDAAIFRTWIAMMGRQSALQHLAHLFCELFMRLQAVGLVTDNSCVLPLTQEEIADALGLSIVHTNRSLQSLRESELLVFDRFRLTVTNWRGLQELAQFDPSYLHLKPRG